MFTVIMNVSPFYFLFLLSLTQCLIHRTNTVADLYIDGTLVNTVTSPGSHVGLDASNEIFIGKCGEVT